ncbi:plasmolipin [Oncorhynchus kisutch]|uniref:Plasmolipin n=1 Tax=Oncorhynchus kisutch TaxID=8019 RepID=A0A8C7CDU2_ONCKI|nr:plasmolipin [Oncorhynchus kisutch]
MSDFPDNVATETSSTQSQQGGSSFQLASISMDLGLIKSIPGILMLAEIGLGLLQWALIASASSLIPAYGWVMFVAVTLWLLTIILFFMLFFGAYHKLSSVPWPMLVMVYNAMATVLYLTAFLANAASVAPYISTYFYGHMAAAAFFGIVVTLLYGASTFFSYLAWKGDGGNTASNSGPA